MLTLATNDPAQITSLSGFTVLSKGETHCTVIPVVGFDSQLEPFVEVTVTTPPAYNSKSGIAESVQFPPLTVVETPSTSKPSIYNFIVLPLVPVPDKLVAPSIIGEVVIAKEASVVMDEIVSDAEAALTFLHSVTFSAVAVMLPGDSETPVKFQIPLVTVVVPIELPLLKTSMTVPSPSEEVPETSEAPLQEAVESIVGIAVVSVVMAAETIPD